MLTCECCEKKRESVTIRDCGVMLCDDCDHTYSEEVAGYYMRPNVDELQEIDNHYRAEGW